MGERAGCIQPNKHDDFTVPFRWGSSDPAKLQLTFKQHGVELAAGPLSWIFQL